VLAAKFPTGDLIELCLLLIGGICVLGVLVWWVRRMLLPRPGGGWKDDWSLQHLRDLRGSGQITEAEFQALKRRLLAVMRSPDGRKDGATPASEDDDPRPKQ
jgi:hypothetical protein